MADLSMSDGEPQQQKNSTSSINKCRLADEAEEYKLTNDSNNPQDNSTAPPVLLLEERIRNHEVALQAWRKRQEQVAQEHKRALQRKQRLLERRARGQERLSSLEIARTKHLTLQQNLQESLIKSRERLQRLTTLEAMIMEEGIGGETLLEDNDLLSAESITENVDVKENESMDAKINDTSFAMQAKDDTYDEAIAKLGGKSAEAEISSSSLPVLIDLYSLENLRQYHSTALNDDGSNKSTRSKYRRSLLGFLPCLDAKRVADYLTLTIQEANALDNSEGANLGTSLRRKLLENTCLDILMLANENTKNTLDSNSEEDNRQYMGHKENTLSSVDPNLSLCPYELAGVCADDLCPYQHTSKDPKILARERLPLPPLSTFLKKMTKSTSPTPVSLTAVPQTSNGERSNQNTKASATTKPECNERSIEGHSGENNDSHVDDVANVAEVGDDFLVLPTANSSASHLSDSDEEMASVGSLSVEGDDSIDTCAENEESLPITGVPTRDAEKKETNVVALMWWCDDMLPQQPQNETETSPSILEVLQEMCGIVLLAANENQPLRRLEVKGTYASRNKTEVSLNESKSMHAILGRLVDSIRLSIHAGREDIAFTLCRALDDREFLTFSLGLTNQGIQPIAPIVRLLQLLTKSSWKNDGNFGVSFQNSLAVHAVLAILSWTVGNLRESLTDVVSHVEDAEYAHSFSLVEIACCGCWEILRTNESIAAEDKVSKSGPDMETLNRLVWKDAQMKRSVDGTIDYVNNLKDLVLWSRDAIAITDVSNSFSVKEWLNTTWSIFKKYIRVSNLAACENESPSSLNLALTYRNLKAIVPMAYLLLGALEKFATATSTNEGKFSTVSLQYSDWSILDGAIFQLVKELSKEVSSTPLLHLVLAPLHAACVASAAFLHNYSVAQHRLERCLVGLTPLHRFTASGRLFVLRYSELLWSQLIQLRMLLPNESMAESISSSLQAVGKKKSPENKKEFSWEPSEFVKEEILALTTILESLDVRLNHVVLWNDWLLSLAASSGIDDNAGFDLLPFVSTEWVNTTTIFHWNNDIWDKINSHSRNMDVIVDRHYPSAPPLSSFPLFLLHIGHHLTELNLSRSFLSCLPRSFGKYFPNVTVLDLSHNHLTALPESFQNTPKRMTSLQKLKLDHNRLESLPDHMFATSSSGKSGTSSTPSSSASSLRILDLSYNRLTSVPVSFPNNLTHLEELLLDHNALTEMSVMDTSRLTIKLHNLRRFTYDSQNILEAHL